MTPSFADLAVLLLFLALTGAFAGVLAGLLGVGGGIVIVAALFYVFTSLGYPEATMMHVCVATSLATIIPTSLRAVRAHHKRGAVDWALLRGWAPFMAVGAVLGVAAAQAMRSDVLMVVFGVAAFAIALHMAFDDGSRRFAEAPPAGRIRAGVAGGMGFVSTLMGIGGGTFGVPILSAYAVRMHRAVATSAGFGVVIAAPAVAGFLIGGWWADDLPPFTFGYVNAPAVAVIAPMTVLCAPLGVKLAHGMNPKPLKLLFALFLAITALNMLRTAVYG